AGDGGGRPRRDAPADAAVSARLRHALAGPPGVLALWVALAVASQRWWSWEDGIRLQFAADSAFYETIARAAPGLPDVDVLRAYAQRFPAHWLVGVLHDLTGVPLHALYRVATGLAVALALLAVHRALTALALDVRAYALAIGVFAASAYPVHYLLASPGMLSDALFVLGLSVLLLGLVRGRLGVALGGIALAVLGRQTALPVALAAAAWVAIEPRWRPSRSRSTPSSTSSPRRSRSRGRRGSTTSRSSASSRARTSSAATSASSRSGSSFPSGSCSGPGSAAGRRSRSARCSSQRRSWRSRSCSARSPTGATSRAWPASPSRRLRSPRV